MKIEGDIIELGRYNSSLNLKEVVYMSKKILVALDNSDYAPKVMLQAIEFAKLYNTSLHVISVIDDTFLREMDETDQLFLDTKAYWTMSVQSVLDNCTKIAEEKGVGCDVEILTGKPAPEIIKFAEEKYIDFIVLGHLGKTAAKGFTIGSVAQKVAAHSKCSVLIVK